MGLRADRCESMYDEASSLDEVTGLKRSGAFRTAPSIAPISQVRLRWSMYEDDSDTGPWDATSHTTWDSAFDAPVREAQSRDTQVDEIEEGEAAKLVRLATRLTVADFMERAYCVRPNVRLHEIADTLETHDVVVADRHGVPLGIIQRRPAAPSGEASTRGPTCGEAMEPVGTLEETDRLSKALGLMAAQGIPFMCVLSSAQCVVGLIYATCSLARLSREAQKTRPSSEQL